MLKYKRLLGSLSEPVQVSEGRKDYRSSGWSVSESEVGKKYHQDFRQSNISVDVVLFNEDHKQTDDDNGKVIDAVIHVRKGQGFRSPISWQFVQALYANGDYQAGRYCSSSVTQGDHDYAIQSQEEAMGEIESKIMSLLFDSKNPLELFIDLPKEAQERVGLDQRLREIIEQYDVE